jgi:NAD(P)-dependent dehydrogenase (short-subunit alcohol dehydrogenase family)/pimeloyl-ACP methyl ester carboxylesterase
VTRTAGDLDRPDRIVRNGEIDIAVYETGNPAGETVICVHGWPDTHHLWDGIVGLLGDRFHVVTYDTRGHGRTTNPRGVSAFRLAELASDFWAVADAVSPDRRVHALAHDWGSVQVWEAVCDPDADLRIASFTSASGPNLDHMGMWLRRRLARPTPRNLAGPLQQLVASAYTAFFQTPVLPNVVFGLVANERRWARFLHRFDGLRVEDVHLGPTFRHDIVSGLRIYRANIVPMLRKPRDRRTSVAVQLLVNQRDPCVRPVVFSDEHLWTDRLWRRDIEAGHWSPFSHPRVLADAVREFVDMLDGAAPARGLRRSRVRPGRAEFEDHLVVVTGAGSGIGRETALAFARLGADIVVCDVNVPGAKETAALIADVGREAFVYEVDVVDEQAMLEFAGAVIAEHGVPDVLVNNAGIGHAGSFLETSTEDFRRVLDVNLNGVVHGCRAFAQQMVDRGSGGHIVNLASLAAFAPQRAMGPYSTSKAAVLMFSECLRAELAADGIGVTAICPGVVDTNIVATTRFSGVSAEEEARQQDRFARLYARRNYGPDRVAHQIVDAVRKNKAVVPVTPEATQGYYLSRFAPAVTRRLARVDLFGKR